MSLQQRATQPVHSAHEILSCRPRGSTDAHQLAKVYCPWLVTTKPPASIYLLHPACFTTLHEPSKSQMIHMRKRSSTRQRRSFSRIGYEALASSCAQYHPEILTSGLVGGAGRRCRRRSFSSTTRSWGPPTRCWWIPTSSTLRSRTRCAHPTPFGRNATS